MSLITIGTLRGYVKMRFDQSKFKKCENLVETMSFDQKTGLIKFRPILTDLYFKICGKYQGVKELHLLAHIGCKMSLPM